MFFRLATLVLVSAYVLRLSSIFSTDVQCRCRPQDRCWPSWESWQDLNQTIQGNLIALRPAGHVCFGDSHSAEACEEYIKNSHNGTWRVLNPASLQLMNWEYSREGKESCHVGKEGHPAQCAQGRVALYSASVQTVPQVQEVVRFAAAHRLRLTVRNTGHDLAGRSTSPGSLQIHTAGLKGIQAIDSFRPAVPWGQEVDSYGPAVTVGAGVLTGELYADAAKEGYTVVGGSCSTVGISGGWMQGGGYGILSPSKGLGVDNVLEFSMITAEGAYIVANEHHNQDLFWAVRGGGGGTFGIVTSVTFRRFPDMPATVTKLTAVDPRGPGTAFWKAVEAHLRTLPALIHQGISVQTYVMPIFPPGGALLSVEIYAVNQTDPQRNPAIQEFQDQLEDLGLQVQSSDEHFDRISTYLAIPKGLDQAGVVLTASRFVSQPFMASASGPANMIRTLSQLQYGPGDVLSFDGMAGGQVTANPTQINSSAVHPDWRSTLFSLNLGRTLPEQPDWKVYQKVENELKHTQLPLLESIEGGQRGGYLGVPFPYEQHPSRTFWGSNYEGLLEVKRRWDPQDLFLTRIGVGSERWDDEGLCRIDTKHAAVKSAMEHAASWIYTIINGDPSA
ncbi:hypothetical protein ARAM_001602 [Aspergillus rambellii]|uniref:FAD-binding PCMH-type domain-containing protein n=1 Tax=Aspergillus rambellii TaxID=308745 RepID=A0A0F8WRG3_9EURO|nr:hypothetical protein ARAM_001602 [Aspergillus rambellii]